MLKPDEKIDDLLRNDLRIIQSDNLPKFGLEGVLLANFAKVENGWQVCDFCCGVGIVPLLMTSRAEKLSITGIELQPELSDLARRSVELNKLVEVIDIRTGDIRQNDIKSKFELITCNPPFFQVSDKQPHSSRAIARSEVALTIDDVVREANNLLCDKGRLVIIYRASGLGQVLNSLAEWGMGVLRLRFVHHHINSAASTFLVECQKGRKSDGMVEPPLVIYQREGELTREMHGVYFEGKGLESRSI